MILNHVQNTVQLIVYEVSGTLQERKDEGEKE